MYKRSILTNFSLSPQFTFERFIVNNSNRFAYNTSVMVANIDGTTMNGVPLLICGEKGVGKTHLLQAIGNRIKSANPKAKIQFWYCGTLINDLCFAMRNDQEEKFYAQCRDLDVLLIDGEDFDHIMRVMSNCRKKFHRTIRIVALSGRRVVMTNVSNGRYDDY